jgi:hypothetical protein
MEADIASIKAMLEERCATRGETITGLSQRIGSLEAIENQRKGGKAALLGMMTLAGVIGGFIVKVIPFVSGK